jgi:hypothetical protein
MTVINIFFAKNQTQRADKQLSGSHSHAFSLYSPKIAFVVSTIENSLPISHDDLVPPVDHQ